MKIIEITESYDQVRMLLILTEKWVNHIEVEIKRAEDKYKQTLELDDMRSLKSIIDISKQNILEAINGPVLVNSSDPSKKKIIQQYTELYYKLLNYDINK